MHELLIDPSNPPVFGLVDVGDDNHLKTLPDMEQTTVEGENQAIKLLVCDNEVVLVTFQKHDKWKQKIAHDVAQFAVAITS